MLGRVWKERGEEKNYFGGGRGISIHNNDVWVGGWVCVCGCTGWQRVCVLGGWVYLSINMYEGECTRDRIPVVISL